MPRIACWSTQVFLPLSGPVLSWSCLLPYCVLLSSVLFHGPRSRCFAPLRIHVLNRSLQIWMLVETCINHQKTQCLCGLKRPTAVYDAAFKNVCQSKNPELFRFWLVFPIFAPISKVFLRFHRALPTGS